MARSKHSPALFEVVHGKRHIEKSATVLRTPNWWFKGRHRGPAMPVEPVEAPSFDEDAANDPTQRVLTSPIAEPEPVPAPAPEPAYYESGVDDPTVAAARHPRRSGPFHLVVDRDRHELYLRVRYTTAIVAGFAILVVVGLAYATGRQFGRGPSTAMASQSSEEVADGPIERGVMDLTARSSIGPTVGSALGTAGVGIGAGGVSSQPAQGRTTEASIVPPAQTSNTRPAGPTVESKTVVDNGRRIVGRQYVIIQSYPPDKKKFAEEGCEYLVRAGIPCTVEKAPPGWPPTWFSIVGTAGFDKASGVAYDDYMSDIQRIGDKFAAHSKFNKFDPMPVKWKERN